MNQQQNRVNNEMGESNKGTQGEATPSVSGVTETSLLARWMDLAEQLVEVAYSMGDEERAGVAVNLLRAPAERNLVKLSAAVATYACRVSIFAGTCLKNYGAIWNSSKHCESVIAELALLANITDLFTETVDFWEREREYAAASAAGVSQ